MDRLLNSAECSLFAAASWLSSCLISPRAWSRSLRSFSLSPFWRAAAILSVDSVNLLVKSAELLFRVLKVGLKFLAVVFHRLKACSDRVQFAATADPFRLLVHFSRRLTHVLDRILDHAEAKK